MDGRTARGNGYRTSASARCANFLALPLSRLFSQQKPATECSCFWGTPWPLLSAQFGRYIDTAPNRSIDHFFARLQTVPRSRSGVNLDGKGNELSTVVLSELIEKKTLSMDQYVMGGLVKLISEGLRDFRTQILQCAFLLRTRHKNDTSTYPGESLAT